MEVLFTLLAERHEPAACDDHEQSAVVEVGERFRDPMTTAAAIDRLVHHTDILELSVSSYRLEQAKGVQ